MSNFVFSETLLSLARAGDSQAFKQLLAPLRPYAEGLARRFFAPGFEREDLFQEAMAGFAGALLTFEPGRGLPFADFAKLSMRNSVVNCVRRATRAKRQIALCWDEELHDLTSDDEFRPDSRLERRSECLEMLESLRPTLSSLEWTVLSEVVSGIELDEVALRHGLVRRAAENALSRARAKARRLRPAA